MNVGPCERRSQGFSLSIGP